RRGPPEKGGLKSCSPFYTATNVSRRGRRAVGLLPRQRPWAAWEALGQLAADRMAAGTIGDQQGLAASRREFITLLGGAAVSGGRVSPRRHGSGVRVHGQTCSQLPRICSTCIHPLCSHMLPTQTVPRRAVMTS